ncbi:MAG: hypothetical protein KA059_08435 [Elusimicrobiales bacterium]|nr:hypothetical protein [Elusimicrobiales bacterium]
MEGTHNFIANEILVHNTYISGNVGIGTTSPSARFEVQGSGISDTILKLNGVGSQTAPFISVVNSANSELLTLNAEGNLGIGTTNPGAKLDVNGDVRLARVLTQAADSGITISTADFGKTITINSSSDQTVTLPSVSASDVGATITVVKLGSGKVTIDAPSGVYIADSSAGGTIYNNTASQTYATISLRLVTADKWVIMWGDGCWTTD